MGWGGDLLLFLACYMKICNMLGFMAKIGRKSGDFRHGVTNVTNVLK